MPKGVSTGIWLGMIYVVTRAFLGAANSPLLAWRDPVYIIAGFSGIAALTLLLIQPLLAANLLRGLSPVRARRVHRWIGSGLTAAVVLHVAALWRTSPPDVVDALLYRSPTPFSIWGVSAMWLLFIAASFVSLRRKSRLRPSVWSTIHRTLMAAVVVGSVAHTLQITGTMDSFSKALLCGAVVVATAWAVWPHGRLRPRAPKS